jgi:methyltransferase-like protein/SAM-dependent methyltransferase
MDALLQSYEEVPYLSDPVPQTHPDALATPAYLAGMSPPPVEKCRVVEVGCGTGGNLIALAAALPESRFVGIDLSPSQIAEGQKIATALGLQNLTLVAGDLRDFDPGEVDYLIAHGVYSWCPPPVQEALLSLAARRLSPQGVAYVSYNALPGWRNLGLWRDLLRWGGRGNGPLRARMTAARRFLELVAQAAGDEDYRAEVRDGVDKLRGLLDQDIAHDFMEEYNEALTVRQFVARAQTAGLQYLGDAGRQSSAADVPPPLKPWASGCVEAEQCLDFVRNTTFHRSLLCHGGVALQPPRAARLAELRLNTLCEPLSAEPEVKGTHEESFRAEHGTLKTDMPLVKAILVQLHKEWPRTLSLGELGEKVRSLLGEGSDDTVAQAALECWSSNLLALHLWSPHFVLEAGERPATTALVRLQAARGSEVTNLRHRTVSLNAFELALLQKLDGTRDRTALVAELSSSGGFTIEKDGRNVTDPVELRPLVEASLAPTLGRLAHAALLEA